MKLPASFTTVTPFSKIIAAVLFIILPFLGFYFGIEYKKLSPTSKEYAIKEKIVKLPAEDDARSMNKRCGDMPAGLVIKGHYTVAGGPLWAPDCRHIAWSLWESGSSTLEGGIGGNGPYKHEGVYIYSDRTQKTVKAYTPKLPNESVMIGNWVKRDVMSFSARTDLNSEDRTLFLYDITTSELTKAPAR